MLHSLFQAMKMTGIRKDRYSLTRSSEDDLSKDSLLEKERNFHEQRPPFWRRHRNMLLVQVVLLALYTLAMYFVAAKIRSQSLHGPNLIRCTHPVDWQSRVNELLLLTEIAPAGEAVIWEEHEFTLGDRIQEKSKYSGKPSPALDKAWHDLLNGVVYRVLSSYRHPNIDNHR